jgi:hypothetical protein
MKTTSVFRGSATGALACIVMAGAGFFPAAADPVAKEQFQQNQTDEQDVRAHTAAVVAQIQSLIDELSANGISGDDIKVLQATKAALSNLSGPEMDRVIASLQKAGHATSTTDSQQNAVNAYAGQKGIILQFQQILKDYEARQAAYELPVRFKELTDRQTETMLTSIDVARATAGKTAAELTTMQQTTQQIAQADQDAIANEVALAVDQLNRAAQGATGDEAQALQHAQSDLKSGLLTQALTQANDDLKAGRLLKAVAEQKTARDELRRLDQDLNPPTTAVDALTTQAATLEKLIAEQQGLLTETNAAVNVKPRVTGLDTKQGTLIDEGNTLQQDMQTLSATTSGYVKDAVASMQLSRNALAAPWGNTFSKAADSQQDAIAKLQEAEKQLQQQVADAQKAAADASKDPTAQLQQLQQQIQTAQQQQQQVNAQTTQAANNSTTPDTTALAQAQQQQAQLQQQTAALQQSAQPLSLQATQALANAAQQMNQAQQDLADPTKTAAAQTAQQAAQSDLAQANQQITQQLNQAQQTPADPAAVAAAADALQKAQNSVSDAIAKTTPPPAGTPSAPPPQLDAAAKSLADASDEAQTAAKTPGLPDAATKAVQAAQDAIAKGKQMAAKKDASGALAQENAAQQQLAQAQAAVAMAQAGLAAAAPPPPGSGPPDANPQPGPPGSDPAQGVTAGSTQAGTLHDASGHGKFVALEARDRAAIDQTQTEKRPQEYSAMIDQYMKNLADQSSSAP